ncbi:VCBS repeat-containing protein [Streptomyces sp. NPDC058308]|uniref:VCBS repeat-containing protein n=1 Tax=Streptomyces sp. NPDC058308 TaxID=3346440 RepID=UPI0036E56CD4
MTKWGTVAALVMAATASFSLGAPPATAASCTAGVGSDFNGDGIRDMAVADPEATVEGKANAGLVRIVLGGDKGVTELSQALSGMTANPEAGDKFGASIAVYDADKDGCDDLAVGAPYEDVSTTEGAQADAGAVYVIHGRPTGLGEGSTVESYTQAGLDGATTTEAGDLFGYALAAGATSGGKPYLAVGVPGEAIEDRSDAGCIHYVQGTTKTTVNQDDPDVPGVAEPHDRFGHSLAATSRFIAVGAPGEAIGEESFAGAVTLFNHALVAGRPTALDGVDEDHPALVSGASAKDDRFGTALSMVPYRPSGADAETDALVAVGTPNENIGTVADAGAVTVIRIKPSGAVTEVNFVDRLASGGDERPATADFFGQRVALANTVPGEVGTTETIKLAVSVPNQEVGAAENAGAVHVLSALDRSGGGGKALTRGKGLPGTAQARDFAGLGLWASYKDLYVGVPYSKTPADRKGLVYAMSWKHVEDGTGSVRTLKPGADGIPDEGKAFGSDVR